MITFIIMMTLGGGLLLYLLRVGKKIKIADDLMRAKKAIGKINRFNRKEDEEAQKQADNAGCNPVSAPWLRNRRK
jgi:hypothetical protein